jgi:hypothetical protein
VQVRLLLSATGIWCSSSIGGLGPSGEGAIPSFPNAGVAEWLCASPVKRTMQVRFLSSARTAWCNGPAQQSSKLQDRVQFSVPLFAELTEQLCTRLQTEIERCDSFTLLRRDGGVRFNAPALRAGGRKVHQFKSGSRRWEFSLMVECCSDTAMEAVQFR